MVHSTFLQASTAEYLPTGNSVIARLLARLEIQLADWQIRDSVLVFVRSSVAPVPPCPFRGTASTLSEGTRTAL